MVKWNIMVTSATPYMQMHKATENFFTTVWCKKDKSCIRMEFHSFLKFLWHLDLFIHLGHQGCFLKTASTDV